MSASPRYALSPGGQLHDEAHIIPERITKLKSIKPEKVPDVNFAAKIKVKKDVKFDVAKYGMKVGAGAHGQVFLCTATPELKAKLKEGFDNGGVKVFEEFPATGATVIVKVQQQQKNMPDNVFFELVAQENTVHKKLTAAPACRAVPLATRPICVSEYVCKFFMGYVTGSPKKHVSITVMEAINGIPVDKFVTMMRGKTSLKASAKFYVEFERAVCSLWLAGYVHGDLHRGNALVNPTTGEIKLIDFGTAFKLPDIIVKNVSIEISRLISSGHTKSLADVWTDTKINGTQTLRNYANRVMKSHYSWYNADYKVLQTMFNDIAKGGKALVPKLRTEIWGIPIKASPTSSLEEGEIRSSPIATKKSPTTKKISQIAKKKSPWKPKNGIYWANMESPESWKTPKTTTPAKSPTPESRRDPTPKPAPRSPTPQPVQKSPTPKPAGPTNTGRINAKGRKVYEREDGKKFVLQNGKRVFVRKTFTPKATPPAEPGPVDTGKVDAKKRKVYEQKDGKKFVIQNGKRVFVRKTFTPKATSPQPTNTGRVDAKKRKVYERKDGKKFVIQNGKRVFVRKTFTPK